MVVLKAFTTCRVILRQGQGGKERVLSRRPMLFDDNVNNSAGNYDDLDYLLAIEVLRRLFRGKYSLFNLLLACSLREVDGEACLSVE